MFYKSLHYQTEEEDSPAGPEEADSPDVNCLQRGPHGREWQERARLLRKNSKMPASSVVQPQESEFCQQHVSLEEDPKLQRVMQFGEYRSCSLMRLSPGPS